MLQTIPAADDGQLNLPRGGHVELLGGGQPDYFVWLLSVVEAHTEPPVERRRTATLPTVSIAISRPLAPACLGRDRAR